jgi:hypothetical protein
MTFAPIRPRLVVRNISRYDVNILGRVKLRPGEERDLYAELEYNDFGSLTTTVLKELESPSGEIYRLWKVLNAIRVTEFVNPTHVGAGVSADSFSTSNAYFEGAILGFESGELKWLTAAAGGGVASVTATSPLSSSGGTTPNISLGTVGVAKGGTGQTSLAANAVLLGNGALGVQTVAPGTAGNVLTSNGTTWSSAPAPATGVASVSASSPLSSSGGVTPDISFSAWPADIAGSLTNDGYGGLSWVPATPTPPGGGLGDLQINDGSGGFTGSTDLSFVANVLEVNNTIHVTNGGSTLSVQPASLGSDATTLTVDAGSLVQIGGVADVNISGAYTLPGIDGYTGQVLTTNGSGVTAWSTPAATGVTSVGASAPLASSGGTTPTISLATAATGNALISGGVGVASSYGKIGLATHVSGTLPVGNGGTGASTLAAGALLFGNGGSSILTDASNLFWDDTNNKLFLAGVATTNTHKINIGTSGSDPAFAIASGGRIHYYDGTGATDNQILIGETSSGSFAKKTLTAGTNIAVANGPGTVTVGLTGQVAVANGGTGLATPGSTGNVLTSNGTSWVSSSPTGGPPSGAAGGDLTGSTYPNPIISSFGGKTHWVVIGGKYATLQAAVNAAAADDTIIVGPPTLSGTWADPLTGGTVFPAGKRLSVIGLTGKATPLIDIGKVSFTVSSGLNILQNELYLRGLFVNGSFAGSQGVLFSGTNPARLRLQDCYIFNSGTSGDCIVVENTGSSSSIYLDGCIIQTSVTNTSSIMVRHTAGYTLIKNGTEITGGGANVMTIAAGTVEVFNSLFETSALSTGTVTAFTANTITDSSKNYTVNSLVGQTVYIAAGTGAGQSRIITANTATQITVGVNWSPNPGALASTFSVGTPRPVILVTGTTGTTASITTTTIRAPIGDSTGISITGAGAVVGMNNSVLSVASGGGGGAGTGTGYAISGVAGAVVVAGQMAYSNSAIVPFNVKFKSTLSISTVTQSSTALANAGLTSAA